MFELWQLADDEKRKKEEIREWNRRGELSNSFPVELWILIFRFLSPVDLLSCRSVNRKWFHLVNDSELWKEMYLRNHDEEQLSSMGLSSFSLFLYFQLKHDEQQKKRESAFIRNRILSIEQKRKEAEEKQMEFWNMNVSEPRICIFCSFEYLEVFNRHPSCIDKSGSISKHVPNPRKGNIYWDLMQIE